ncbi:hypothetical protein HNR44_001560 [Geomicrobium halophilum]|uniref:Uncharacterized protein n=1 Tax=Geomicrobium halophilum TaxID=549000 RepID=A0A841PTI0_9BACL|nr:hypothetical protein [Geomicrobium halophilum]MBB6449611.1 hypothetical protein [Geomicrobium halophilum]
MRTWDRVGYSVSEVPFDHDLHEFIVTGKGGETIVTITPADLNDQAQLVADLDAGEDVDGWEDGKGNTINVEGGE